MLDIHWTLTVQVPQLDALRQTIETIGAQLVADLSGIHDAIVTLGTQQAAGSQAIADQLTAIADEISQINLEQIKQEDLDTIAAQIRESADLAQQQAAAIQANTEQIAGIVPDEPPSA